MILGAVLAGGQSTRFGSDKALAELGGRTLLARAVDRLSEECDLVVIAGRESGPAYCLPDWPHAGMGPLGGIAAALRWAQDEHYETILTCGVDSVNLPDDLAELLSPAPAFLESQPVIGLWPSSAAQAVEAILTGDGRHSMMALAQKLNARAVKIPVEPDNINTQADLAATERSHGI